jgi:hypothetical protein
MGKMAMERQHSSVQRGHILMMDSSIGLQRNSVLRRLSRENFVGRAVQEYHGPRRWEEKPRTPASIVKHTSRVKKKRLKIASKNRARMRGSQPFLWPWFLSGQGLITYDNDFPEMGCCVQESNC